MFGPAWYAWGVAWISANHRVPSVTPVLSAAFALYIISGLPYSTFALFAVWLGVAAIIYFTYSARHSRLARGEEVATEEPR